VLTVQLNRVGGEKQARPLILEPFFCIIGSIHRKDSSLNMLKPRRLVKGDLIGIVSPASTIADLSRIDRGVTYLERLGYRVTVGKHVTKVYGYLAGTDEERVADLHEMFANANVKAVFCIRGGYGTPRILSQVNYRLIGRHPKIFVGYSDITALQLAIWRKCRLVTFHGPMLGVDLADPMDSFTEEMLWRVLTSPKRLGNVLQPDEPVSVLRQGRCSGPLLGGNLALLTSIMGTGYLPSFDGALLYIEDIGEEPYRVDRMLAQLRHAGILDDVKGVLGGKFTDCGPKDPSKPSLTLDQVFLEAAEKLSGPFLANLPFGHESKKMTIPLGIRGRFDTSKKTVEYLEGAVT
jgi:muramoyltetrapeptide carboxypeptidase